MNTSAPLPPDQLDELLSADLDGEFDAAARDLDLEPAQARERIALTPGASERRAALAQAREAIAAGPALDDAVAARLRANAIAAAAEAEAAPVVDLAARHRKRYRVIASAGAIAAAVALVLGIVANANSSDDSQKSAGASRTQANANANDVPTQSTVLTVPFTFSLGDAKTGDELAQRLNLSASAYQQNNSAFSAGTADATTHEAFLDTGTNTVAPAANQRKAAAAATNCDKVAHDLTGVNDPPIVRATGKVGGAPVFVYVFRSGPNEIVLMLNTKCQYVYRQARPAS